jgi:CheY-specific phosphatase CheX
MPERMPERNYDQMFAEAVSSVLETMFFTAPLGLAAEESGQACMGARVAFRGTPSGQVRLCLSEASAQLLAAGFLGEDEESLSPEQTGLVVCELANMLCGSLLSQLESQEHFDLAAPQLDGDAVPPPEQAPVATQSFELENGVLRVALYLDSDLESAA